MIACATTLLLFAFNTTLKAQCGPYLIKNNSLCEATINYVITCNGIPCSTGTGAVLFENGGQIKVGCPSCAGKCSLSVTITQSGTLTITPPVTVSASNPGQLYPSPCPPSAARIIAWSPAGVTIN